MNFLSSSSILVQWLLAAIPIGVVLVLMVFFRWGGSKAGPVGLLAALIIGVLAYQGGGQLLIYSQIEGLLLSLHVLYIIWMALVLFRVVEKVGAIQVIGQNIVRLSSDSLIQLLILAWVFSSFLQGVAGFGVPIAVVAPLLIGLGFDPVIAVAGTAIGHSWSVSFGDMASSFNALIAASGLTGWELGPWAATFLGVACIACGLALCHAYDGWNGLRRGALAIVLIGGSMALTQYLLVSIGLWNLGGFVAGMVGIAVSVLVTRLPFYNSEKRPPEGSPAVENQQSSMSVYMAVFPYLVLIVVVAAAELWEPLHHFLNQIKIAVPLAETSTGLGWTTPAKMGKQISLFGHAGALLAYSSIIAFLFYWRKGHLKPGDVSTILRRTVKSATPSSIGILSMVGMAMIMDRCGMTNVLARGLANVVGGTFPLISPFIGLLGAFMTGSNTNSNVVFTALQQDMAGLVGATTAVILAAQTTGGALGSMIAPAKLIVGCSTAGLEGKEGRVLRITLRYGLLIALLAGVIALVAA